MISTHRCGVDEVVERRAVGNGGGAKRHVVAFAAVPKDLNVCSAQLLKISTL